MAVTFVQSSGITAQAGTTQTLTLNSVTTGNLLVVGMSGFDTSTNPTIVSINDGINSYSAVTGCYTTAYSNGFGDVWYAPNVIGGNLTLTITTSDLMVNANAGMFTVAEFAGASTSSPVYAGIGIDDTSLNTQFTGPTVTVTNANDMAVCFGYWAGNSQPTGAGGWSDIITAISGTGTVNIYYAPGATGNYAGTVATGTPGGFITMGLVISAGSSTPTNISNAFLVF
jgi:hypothetical protein